MSFITLYYKSSLLLFAVFGVLFIPFSFNYFWFQKDLTQYIFGGSISLLQDFIIPNKIINQEITSDSTALYLLLLTFIIVSLIGALALSTTGFWKKNYTKYSYYIRIILVYYLALVMLKYGVDKLFKSQFYLPEPNLLYTPLGYLDKDILYWSTMGTSYSYSVFGGLMEVVPALMLLFRKTRVLGLFILLGVLLNVVNLNFGFDISVKLFSLFLLFLTILLLAPYLKSIYSFFLKLNNQAVPAAILEQATIKNGYSVALKIIVLIAILIETLYPVFGNKNVNDDTYPRPYLHGAYQVESITSSNTNFVAPSIKRFFIHRRNYLIFQYEDETMQDYTLKTDSANNKMVLMDYDKNEMSLSFEVNKIQNKIKLTYNSNQQNWQLMASRLDWEALPLLQPLFHWAVDEIK